MKIVQQEINLHRSFRKSDSSCTCFTQNTEDQQKKIKQVLSQLTPEELETAACASYEYRKKKGIRCEQEFYASRMIQRYLDAKNGAVDVATVRLKATLKFRQDIDIDGLVQAFDESNDYTVPLKKQLTSKKMFVQGYDREGRSTLIFIPRLVVGHDPEWTLKEAVYSIERAVAASRSETINAVIDFSGFSALRHAPPLEIGKQFLTTLRKHYAGQIHKIFLVDTPRSFSFFWKVFKPFVGTLTRRKIVFVSTERKEEIFSNYYTLDQATEWMRKGGKKTRPLDTEEYLFQVPFEQAFDAM